MSLTLIKTKVVEQAEKIAMMTQQMNFLLRELYKVKPDHEVFTVNQVLAKNVSDAIKMETSMKEVKNETESY
jgi:hypothetical protein